jgi:hypothetical protein
MERDHGRSDVGVRRISPTQGGIEFVTNLSGTERRTAGVLVEVISVNQPGQVVYVVRNVGPVMLAKDQVVRALRAAANQVEESYS